MKQPPHPPDETAEQLKAALRRNHPEMTDAEIDAVLGADPAPRRPGNNPQHRWYSGKYTGKRRSISRSTLIHRRGNRRK